MFFSIHMTYGESQKFEKLSIRFPMGKDWQKLTAKDISSQREYIVKTTVYFSDLYFK